MLLIPIRPSHLNKMNWLGPVTNLSCFLTAGPMSVLFYWWCGRSRQGRTGWEGGAERPVVHFHAMKSSKKSWDPVKERNIIGLTIWHWISSLHGSWTVGRIPVSLTSQTNTKIQQPTYFFSSSGCCFCIVWLVRNGRPTHSWSIASTHMPANGIIKNTVSWPAMWKRSENQLCPIHAILPMKTEPK